MPFLIMRRDDIPDGALQVLDLIPNTSLRNQVYDPAGQTGYVRNIPTQDVVATTGAGPVTTVAEYGGLAAYLIDNVENASGGEGTALSAAIANTAATSITANANSGSETLTLPSINGLLIGAGAAPETSLTPGVGSESTGDLEELLSLLSGRNYVLPAGSMVGGAANIFIEGRRGEFTEPFRKIEDGGTFRMSVGEGYIAAITSESFTYGSTAGTAIDVFEDDGTRV
jgi:hypothetical protein